MEEKSNCKGCSRSVRVPSEDIRNMVEEIKNSGSFNIVKEEEYNKRLNCCSECRYLEYDTTCSQCGCIVQVRAILKDKDCPHPSKPLWL